MADNAYHLTNFLVVLKKFLAYTLFPPTFIVVRPQMAELNGGGGGGKSPRTPSKIEL